MASKVLRSFFLFFIFNCVIIVNANVPLLLWESTSISDKEDVIPALDQLDSDEFSSHLVKKVYSHKPLIALFLEESLSVEDFSWKDDHGKGSFPHLQNITSMASKTEFITSVDDPLSSIEDLTLNQGYKWVKYDGKKFPSSNAVILEIQLEDPFSEEDRPELLQRHDKSILALYNELTSKQNGVIGVFTGKYSSWVEPGYNRVKRQATGNETPDGVFYLNFTEGIIESSTAPELKLNDSVIKLDNPVKINTGGRKNAVSLIAHYMIEQRKDQLQFRFKDQDGKWILEDVNYSTINGDKSLKPNKKISARKGASFQTSSPVTFSDPDGDAVLTFKDLKAEPWASQLHTAADDTVYFTKGILMGLFITIILGLILMWGLIMILDIRTMDRFDDPKGKTITVAQAE